MRRRRRWRRAASRTVTAGRSWRKRLPGSSSRGAIDSTRRRKSPSAAASGSSETLVTPETLDFLGYNPRNAEAVTTVTSVVGGETG